jgi:hypothetical protein
MQIIRNLSPFKRSQLQFGNQDSDGVETKSPEFSRTKDYFLYQCGQNRDTEPYASFAASYLNTALNLSFGIPHSYQALASDDESIIQLTIHPDKLSRLNDVLTSHLFDLTGDRWKLLPSEKVHQWILREQLRHANTGQTDVRDIPVMIVPAQ